MYYTVTRHDGHLGLVFFTLLECSQMSGVFCHSVNTGLRLHLLYGVNFKQQRTQMGKLTQFSTTEVPHVSSDSIANFFKKMFFAISNKNVDYWQCGQKLI